MCHYDWYSLYFFFFSSRRRHTRFKWDWSSDVCSSDLLRRQDAADLAEQRVEVLRLDGDHDERGASDSFGVRERDPNAVALFELARSLLVADGRDDLSRLAPAAAQQPAQERFADRAGAQDGDAA